MISNETSIDILKSFLNADLVERDAEKALSFLSRDIFWFGTSDNEDIHGLDEARDYLEQEIALSDKPYLVEYIRSIDQTKADGSGAAQLKCRVTGNGVVMHCRCSATTCTEDGQQRILALHMSVPDSVQQEGEFFPFSLAEQYEKELHEDFFEEMVDGGVLGRYYESSAEIYVVNKQLLDFLGYPSEEVFRCKVKNCASNTIFPEDRKYRLECVDEQLAKSDRYLIEYRMLRYDGTPVWVEAHGKLVITREGRQALVGIVNDITNRKQAEKQLQEVNREIAAIYNNIPGGAFRCKFNADWNVVYANDGLFKFLGYTRDEFATMGNKMSAVIYEEDKEPMIPIIQKQLEQGNTIANTNRLVCKDGTIKWISIHATLFIENDGEQYFYCIFVDITAQKKAEKQLLESDERYRVAIDGAGVNVWEYDIINKRIIQSDGSMKNHGFNKIVENVPQVLLDTEYVVKEDQPAFMEMFEKMWRGESPVGGDFWVYNAEKNGRWCERIFYSVICDDTGKPIKAYGSSQDVTPFKIAEKKYKEEIDYRNRMADSVIAACCINLTGRYVEELRVGTGDSIADKHRDAVEYEDRVRVFAYDVILTDEQKYNLSPNRLLKRYESGVDNYETEFVGQLTKGNYIWVRCRVNILKRPDTGEIVAFFYNEDVTQEKTLAGIVDSVVKTDYEFISRIDVNSGKYTAISRDDIAAPFLLQSDYNTELKKYAEYNADFSNAEKIYHDLSIENIVRELETKTVFTYETEARGFDGIPRRKQLHYFYLNKEAGFILATRTDIDDIIKKEQAKQEALEQAINAKSDFLSRMSHDMRTPMNAIIGLSSLAMDTKASPETIDYLQKINSSGKYLLGLINDTLDMSRIESGKLSLNPEPYPGHEFAETLRNILEPKAIEKSINFMVDGAFDTAPTLMMDKLRFAQIFVNLANNAIKFTPEGGSVLITLEFFENQDGIQTFSIAVKDNGIGMSEEFQKRMYDSFEQEGRSTGDEVGTGLGLAIVKRLVEVMNGKIACESTVGKGTTFRIAFRAHFIDDQPKSVNLPHQPCDLSVLSGKHILLVEDHPLNIQVASKLLEKKGIIVEVAENGKLAVELFEKSPLSHFDMVLMDIRMPVMDGLEATKQIRSLKRTDAKLLIIAMTANAYEEDIEKSKLAGMDAHLAKPIEPQQLYTTLAGFMANCVQTKKLQ